MKQIVQNISNFILYRGLIIILPCCQLSSAPPVYSQSWQMQQQRSQYQNWQYSQQRAQNFPQTRPYINHINENNQRRLSECRLESKYGGRECW